MHLRFRQAALSLSTVLAVCAHLVAAPATPEPPAPEIPPAIRVPVWIEDNRPAADPFAVRFEATINGRPARIATAQGPTSDLIVLVILDVTGDISLVEPAKQSLIENISRLPANAWAGVLRAQDGLHVLADPGPDRKPAIDAISTISTNGTPGLFETIDSALRIADAMMRTSPVRVAVLYVTDGNIYRYREDYTNPVINSSDPHDLSRKFPEALIIEKVSKLQTTLASLEAPLFIVHLHYRPDRLNEAYQNGLTTLANETAGEADFARSPAEIPDSLNHMFTRMLSGWSLTLALPPKPRENLEVKITGHSGDTEARLAWRSRYVWKRK